MKKITQKLMLLLLSAILIITVPNTSTALAADKTKNITLRIEGIEKNIYYGTVNVPYTDSLTLQKALSYIDSQEKGLTITGVDTAYITEINGETAGKFGGWDGWLFTVNGEAASVGIDSLQLNDGDSVIVYYGDPFGVGMQYPVADTTDMKDGIIRFTSSDTTFDADYNAIVTVNPVVGVTVTWSNGDTNTDYVTDDNGAIKLDKADLTSGMHAVQVSKVGDSSLPLVLRYAPDYTVSVNSDRTISSADNTTLTTDKTASTSDNTASTSDSTSDSAVANATENQLPKTGDSNHLAIITLIMAAGSLMGVLIMRSKKAYEK